MDDAQPQAGISPLAGQPAPKEMQVDVERLEREYRAGVQLLSGSRPPVCVSVS